VYKKIKKLQIVLGGDRKKEAGPEIEENSGFCL